MTIENVKDKSFRDKMNTIIPRCQRTPGNVLHEHLVREARTEYNIRVAPSPPRFLYWDNFSFARKHSCRLMQALKKNN